MTLLRVETSSYAERGAGSADLSVASSGVNQVTQDIGAKVSWNWTTSQGALTSMLKAEWLHDYTRSPIRTEGTLGDQDFTVGTARPGADGVRLGYGVTLDGGRDYSLKLEGQSDIYNNYQSHSAIIKITAGF